MFELNVHQNNCSFALSSKMKTILIKLQLRLNDSLLINLSRESRNRKTRATDSEVIKGETTPHLELKLCRRTKYR